MPTRRMLPLLALAILAGCKSPLGPAEWVGRPGTQPLLPAPDGLRVAVDPAGKRWATVSDDLHVRFGVIGGGVTTLATPLQGWAETIVWAPDGDAVVIEVFDYGVEGEDGQSATIWRATPDKLTLLAKLGDVNLVGLLPGPGGRSFAWVERMASGGNRLHAHPERGPALVLGSALAAAISPDGQLAVLEPREARPPGDGRPVQMPTPEPPAPVTPPWPEGTGGRPVMVVPLAGGAWRQLVDDVGASNGDLAWTRDGRRIVAYPGPSGENDSVPPKDGLWDVREIRVADGTMRARRPPIAAPATKEAGPADSCWHATYSLSPDGRYLAGWTGPGCAEGAGLVVSDLEAERTIAINGNGAVLGFRDGGRVLIQDYGNANQPPGWFDIGLRI